jgi:hypothetical protein
VHLYDVGGGAEAVLHHQPHRLLLQVAAVVLDTVRVVQPVQEPDLLQDVLPLLQALLPVVGHLLDRHHLVLDIVPGVVDRPEAAMPDLP